VRAAGLDPGKYSLQLFDYVVIDEMKIKAQVLTFDKPRLNKDLLQGAEIKYSHIDVTDYERTIDATGVSRAFLPVIHEDIVLPCVQWRIRTELRLEIRAKLGRIGYAWCFPLGPEEYHIGCGSLLSDPRKIMQELGWFGKTRESDILCACTGKIRFTAPQFSLPFVTAGEVWGVGEAIGCVGPLAGDGVVPGMRSVQILLQEWDDPLGYTAAIQREFRWMKAERKVIDKLRGNKPLGIKDAWVLRSNSKRMGMQIGLPEAERILRNLR
jgi:hypothetical protein